MKKYIVVIYLITILFYSTAAAASDSASIQLKKRSPEKLRRLIKKVRDPFGNKFGASASVDWNSELLFNLEADYNFKTGIIVEGKYKKFVNNKQLNEIMYKTEGFKTKLALRKIKFNNWQANYAVAYQKNIYQTGSEVTKEQEYTLLGLGATLKRFGKWNVEFDYGFSLKNNQPNFRRLNLAWDKTDYIKRSKLIYNLKGGLASSKTPINYQFHGGGFKDISLRGHDPDLAGVSYLIGSLEYHRLLVKEGIIWEIPFNFWGITFVDTGKIIPSHSSFKEKAWELDGGIGLAGETDLGIIRVDLALDDFTWEPNYNVSIKFNI